MESSKFEIRKFIIQYSKKLTKSLRLKKMKLEGKLKKLRKITISDGMKIEARKYLDEMRYRLEVQLIQAWRKIIHFFKKSGKTLLNPKSNSNYNPQREGNN